MGPEVCGLWLQVGAVEEGREVEVGEDLGALVAARLVVLGQQEQFQPPTPLPPLSLDLMQMKPNTRSKITTSDRAAAVTDGRTDRWTNWSMISEKSPRDLSWEASMQLMLVRICAASVTGKTLGVKGIGG